MRNLVQHEGVLPAPDQLPRWLAETERMADSLVKASFGVGLNEVGSAAGVADEALQEQLKQAEQALEHGEAERSFDASWKALETGRRQFREKTGLHPVHGASGAPAALRALDRSLGDLASVVNSLTDQVELSAFTAEPGEWLWFKQRQGEKFRGLPPSLADAGRAFAFVLAWVLRFESYIARHGVDRWERWEEEQRPPVTGIPGGPHIRDVREGDRPSAPGGNTEGLRNWVFELTDVPDAAAPSFDWAIQDAVPEVEGSPITHAYLNQAGRLSVTCRNSIDAEDVMASVRRLIAEAHARLAKRAEEDAVDEEVRQSILTRFQAGLEKHGCLVKDLQVQTPRNNHRVTVGDAMVWIDLVNTTDDIRSWFPVGLKEAFAKHFPEAGLQDQQATPYQPHGNAVVVPASWNPERVAAWICDAVAFDAKKYEEESASSREAKAENDRVLTDLKRLIEELGTPAIGKESPGSL